MNYIKKIIEQPRSAPAVYFGGKPWSYGELVDDALLLSAFINGINSSSSKVVAIFGSRDYVAYTAILAAHFCGSGYVPLNHKYPIERTIFMLEASEANILIVSDHQIENFKKLIGLIHKNVTVIFPNSLRSLSSLEFFCGSSFFFQEDLFAMRGHSFTPANVDGSNMAYLLFTSGSTGLPKGVAVNFNNLQSYLGYMVPRLSLSQCDRTSQTFDLTFDLSVHDLFVTWSSGACLYPLSDLDLLSPGRFIRKNKITSWFSVPSLITQMEKTRTLKDSVFESIKTSLFCGEALPAQLCKSWRIAAPKSRVINLYGPTEATIAISEYEYLMGSDDSEYRYGLVPIGQVFPNHQYALIDEFRNVLDGEARGELCLSGPQVTAGYLNDPNKTADQYITLAGERDVIWYKTGDLVERGEEGTLYYVSRLDNQIKILGFRVELQEVENVIRESLGISTVVAVPLPFKGPYRELVACVLGENIDEKMVLEYCSLKLPTYMVPSRVVTCQNFPLNNNGKIDRKKLAELIA